MTYLRMIAATILRTAEHHPDGFTLDAITGKLYDTERGGYAVAPSKRTELVLPAGANRLRLLEEWLSVWLVDLLPEGSYVGGWRRPDGALVLDVSLVVPTLSEALEIGAAGEQEAVFCFRTMESVPVETSADVAA